MAIRVLFLCTANSARSQMAEALLRLEGADRFDVARAGNQPAARVHPLASAGSQPAARVHPLAIAVMQELNTPLADAYPKHLKQLSDQTWDYVITVCDRAQDACPTFPGDTARMHWSLEDPGAADRTEAQRLRVFRQVRDEILRRVRRFVAATASAAPGSGR